MLFLLCDTKPLNKSVSVCVYSCSSVFPESPRWLLATGQIPQAKKSLQIFAVRNGFYLSEELFPAENLLSGNIHTWASLSLSPSLQSHRHIHVPCDFVFLILCLAQNQYCNLQGCQNIQIQMAAAQAQTRRARALTWWWAGWGASSEGALLENRVAPVPHWGDSHYTPHPPPPPPPPNYHLHTPLHTSTSPPFFVSIFSFFFQLSFLFAFPTHKGRWNLPTFPQEKKNKCTWARMRQLLCLLLFWARPWGR